MSDNTAVTAGAGTTIATDLIGGVHYQRVKQTWGVDGTATDTSATNPLPVSLTRPTVGNFASFLQVAGTTGAQNIATLENPAASGKTVRIRRIDLSITAIAATTAAPNIKAGRTTATPTAGTTQTIQKKDAGSAAVGIVRSAPTATAATGDMLGVVMPFGAAVGYNNWSVLLDARDPQDEIILAAGEGFLVRTDGASDADYRIGVTFHWFEI